LKVEVVIIAKQIISEFVKECGFELEDLLDLANEIREGEIELENGQYLFKEKYDNRELDYHFTYSTRKEEKPIMINIRKKKLVELGNHRLFIIDKNGIKTRRT
jgi:hypothetical protein